MTARVALCAVVATLLAIAMAPAVASACNEPMFALTDTTLAPGDTTTYRISNLQAGAEYTLEVEGQLLARGTSTSEHGHVGTTLPMPELGAPRALSVVMNVTHQGPAEPTHDGSPDPFYVQIQFGAPATTPAAASQAPAERPAPAAAADPPAATTPAAAVAPRPASSHARSAVQPRGRATTTRVSTPAKARPAHRARALAPTLAANAAPLVAPGRSAAAARVPRSGDARRAARRDGTARTRALSPPRAATPAPAPAAAPAAAPVAADPQRSAEGSGMLLALLIAVLAHCVAALARLRRRIPAAPRERLPDTEEFDAIGIEEELQQIIAAEREKTTA